MKISEEYCKKQLKRVGRPVKIERTLLDKGGMQQFTLQEALEYASKGKEVIALNINKDKYLNLIRMLIEYKADKPGASKELVDTYFKTRWQLRVFTTRLAQRGHYYMSTERLLGYFGIEEETDEGE